MGANIDVRVESEKLGIDEERTVCYQATEVGTAEMYDDVCKMVCEIRVDT